MTGVDGLLSFTNQESSEIDEIDLAKFQAPQVDGIKNILNIKVKNGSLDSVVRLFSALGSGSYGETNINCHSIMAKAKKSSAYETVCRLVGKNNEYIYETCYEISNASEPSQHSGLVTVFFIDGENYRFFPIIVPHEHQDALGQKVLERITSQLKDSSHKFNYLHELKRELEVLENYVADDYLDDVDESKAPNSDKPKEGNVLATVATFTSAYLFLTLTSPGAKITNFFTGILKNTFNTIVELF